MRGLHEHRVRVRVDDVHPLVRKGLDDALGGLPGEGGYASPDAPIGEAVEGGGEHPVEGVHEDLDRTLQPVVVMGLLGVLGLLRQRLGLVPAAHQVRQYGRQDPGLLLLAQEVHPQRGDDLTLVVPGGEAYVLGDDQAGVHGLEVQHADPVVHPWRYLMNVAALDGVLLVIVVISGQRHGHLRGVAIGRPYHDGVYELRRAGIQHVIHGHARYGRQVHTFPDASDLAQDLERQLGVPGAVSQNLIPVVQPFLVDGPWIVVLPHLHLHVHVQLLLAQQRFRYGVERFLLGLDLDLDRPPCVRDQPPGAAPELVHHPAGGGAVPAPVQLIDPEPLPPFHDEGDVVPVDVIPGDHIGVLHLDDLGEALDHLLLGPDDRLPGPYPALVLDDVADGVDRLVRDGVLDVEAQDLQLGCERGYLREPAQVDHQVRGVIPLYLLPAGFEACGQVVVVDEAVMERYVGREDLEPLAFQLVAVLRHGPGELDHHLGALLGAALVYQE